MHRCQLFITFKGKRKKRGIHRQKEWLNCAPCVNYRAQGQNNSIMRSGEVVVFECPTLRQSRGVMELKIRIMRLCGLMIWF